MQVTENYIKDLRDDVNETNDENKNPVEGEEVAQVASGDNKPKSILKRSQKILENIKPTTSRFDTGSLKKRIKDPLQRIKKMADNQFKKVRSRPTIKKIPVKKDEIILAEEVKILKLKESPKSQHREITSYIVKQDSDETLDIVELDESPMAKKRHEGDMHLVTPDEIIDLPKADEAEQRESTVDSNEISISECSLPSLKEEKIAAPKKREHHYEDIDDYISSITSDIEHVERAPHQKEAKLQRQPQIGYVDPIFDEFSRELNKNIRRSLSAQDDKIRQELAKKIPKIKDIELQTSEEDREDKSEEKVEEPEKAAGRLQVHLLAPISSIDSTSSDEDNRRQLSILAEESETSDSNKKKSFDESSVDREIESLKRDDSEASLTLIDEELKALDIVVPEEIEIVVPEEVAKVEQVEVAKVEEPKEENKPQEVAIEEPKEAKLNIVKQKLETSFETENVETVVEQQVEVKPTDVEIKQTVVEEAAVEQPMVEENEIVVKSEPQLESVKEKSSEVTQEATDKSSADSSHSVKEDSVVKEDVIVQREAEAAPIKISTRWSKMRFVLEFRVMWIFDD